MGNQNVYGKNAFDIFPDLLVKKQQREHGRLITPPPPPDISWLYQDGHDDSADKFENAPSSIVLFSQEDIRILVENTVQKMGFRVDKVASETDALLKIQSFDYPLIINNITLDGNEIHDHICHMPSAKRRMIYYVLVGSHLHTMYNLEALTMSANMVVNDEDLKYLWGILKKGFNDYENLFGPLIEALRMK